MLLLHKLSFLAFLNNLPHSSSQTEVPNLFKKTRHKSIALSSSEHHNASSYHIVFALNLTAV
jgi:hypothetical protein